MLVLSRKVGESIIIGDNIKMKIIKLGKNTVRIAFEAPVDITIYKEEIYQKIKAVPKETSKNGVTHEEEQVK